MAVSSETWAQMHAVNLEADVIAKYVERLLPGRPKE